MVADKKHFQNTDNIFPRISSKIKIWWLSCFLYIFVKTRKRVSTHHHLTSILLKNKSLLLPRKKKKQNLFVCKYKPKQRKLISKDLTLLLYVQTLQKGEWTRHAVNDLLHHMWQTWVHLFVYIHLERQTSCLIFCLIFRGIVIQLTVILYSPTALISSVYYWYFCKF